MEIRSFDAQFFLTITADDAHRIAAEAASELHTTHSSMVTTTC